jgi:hypothetical protein
MLTGIVLVVALLVDVREGEAEIPLEFSAVILILIGVNNW